MCIKTHVKLQESFLLLVINFYGELVQEDITEFKQFLTNHLKGNTKMKCIYDLKDITITQTTMQILKSLGQYTKAIDHFTMDKIIANTIIVDSPVIEKILTMLFTLKTPSTPIKITDNLNDGCEFLNSY